MIWQELTSAEIAGVEKTTPVLLPIAAIEQHGPHLPLATDRMIGEFFAEELHKRLGKNLLVLPTISVGYSEHHMEFPGSLTLNHETLLGVAEQYLHSAYLHGFRNFLILNSHGGNQGTCQVLLERFGASHGDCQTVVATWWRLAPDAMFALNNCGPGGAGHAGEFETSLMLHIAPELVRKEAMQPRANVPTYDWAEGDLIRSPTAALHRTMKQMTSNGAYGEPQPATAAKGKKIAEIVCEALSGILTDLSGSLPVS